MSLDLSAGGLRLRPNDDIVSTPRSADETAIHADSHVLAGEELIP